MKNYITLDCGTTKTKISVVSNGKIIDYLKISSSINTADYKLELKEKISEILKRNSLIEKDIIRILATGTMATAEIGIFPSDYLTVPVNLKALKKGICEVFIPEISDIPFSIVRGVKTLGDSLEHTDTMRGEESELMGIMEDNDGSCVFMFMGSHSKIIKTDDTGNITDICTMLTGELAYAVSQSTILKHSISLHESEIDKEYLKKGYIYCSEKSINEALFKVRLLKNIFGVNSSQAYSFFLGSILFAEVKYVNESKVQKVIVGGNKQLKEAISILLKEFTEAYVMCLTEEQVENSVSFGLVKIYECK